MVQKRKLNITALLPFTGMKNSWMVGSKATKRQEVSIESLIMLQGY